MKYYVIKLEIQLKFIFIIIDFHFKWKNKEIKPFNKRNVKSLISSLKSLILFLKFI